MTVPDIIGSLGVAILLLAYFLNLFNILKSTHPLYSALNAIGAGLSGWASWMIGFMPFVLLEGTWMAVSLVGLYRSMTTQNTLSREQL
jgi:hypothetical protein